MAHLLIVEGDLPEDALAAMRATGATAAHACARALSKVDPTLSFDYAQPYFSDHDIGAHDFTACDGMIVTGSVAARSAVDEQARPFWKMHEAAFAAGVPVFGSGWGMVTAAVVLGGSVAATDPDMGITRMIRPVDHPMMTGRRDGFDAIALSRERVAHAPEGAIITAIAQDGAIMALACDQGTTRFRGVQYHPERGLADLAFWLSRPGPARPGLARSAARQALARDMRLIAEDPAFHAPLCARHRVGLDLLDQTYRMTELATWVKHQVGSVQT